MRWRRTTSARLVVDWPACTARGLCYELLPESITADDWGYPIVTDLDPARVDLARAAVRACPQAALRLVRD